jgi:glycosyltransferase involved in cell wall biosynthesis
MAEFTALPPRTLDLRRLPFDIFHAPTPYYVGWPRLRRPTVVSVLDLIPLEVPGHARTGLKARFFHWLAAGSDVVMTLSEHAAGRIVARLGVERERLVVAPLPVADSFVPKGPGQPGLPSRYVAALVDLRTPDPRKRASWLAPLAADLAAHGVSLVVAGAETENGAIPGTHGMGRIDDPSWAAVLRGAQMFVYTSGYEGQGMPPLEAIACGTPVVAMSNSAIPEVVGRAGVLVPEAADASSIRALSEALLRSLDEQDVLASLRARCSEQAAKFSMDRFAAGVSRAYATAVERS